MSESAILFLTVYEVTQSIEVAIAELKREGFSQIDTVNALKEVLKIDVVEADHWVRNSIAWND